MELIPTSIACASLLCFGVLTFLLTRHLNAMQASVVEPASVPLADRYRPMLRLLSEDDFRYLAAGGWTRSMVNRARAERRSLFRVYLRSLVKDYGRLLAALRLRMVESSVDRPELARALAKNRLLFTASVMKVELRLALHAAGVCNVDVSGLVHAVEALRVQTASFAVPIAAGA